MTTPLLTKAGRVAAITFFAAATGLMLHAQVPATAVSSTSPILNLQAALKAPVNLFERDASSSSSSSSMDATDSVAAERFNLSDDSTQPPPRRYGRPRYTDNMHNADGSNKFAFQIGGGFTLPTGGTHSYFSPSYDFQGGVGRNFNKHVGVMIDFNWANFGIQNNLLNNQLALYDSLGATNQDGVTALSQLNGNGHVWSFSLDPVFNFAQGEKTGAYVTGGVGYYHKTTTFTTPAVGEYCDFYGFCYEYQANQPIDSYTSNAVGVNAGLGYTYKPSRFGNQRFFVEAKYVYTANSRRAETGTTVANTPAGSTAFNAFPQNSAPTTFIPITFGLRF